MSNISIQPERLLDDLNTLRTYGQCGTGVVQPAYSQADVEARQWLAQRMEDAGLQAAVDPIGNLSGLPKSEQPCPLISSHSDSQPEGGWLDGAYGVIALNYLAALKLVPVRIWLRSYESPT